MPQLNPAPWFTILIFSWLVFLIVIPPKVINHAFTNEPAPQNTEKPKSEPWNWPWY
uniref:ATP synthase complex subunit 8 n=3 Tax=Esox TaxID=8009 RepID=T2HN36_ESONI|nr:ATP synthase subunit 8 [Esox niger]QPF96595.1 ATP synthase subunit 8 [Esox americanus vermiculatus]QPF96686.1 ATP synthase subunit 8 [Esox niger]QPF96790.1 ATP synthase subunit 8 [Esox americanus americanus]BAN81587.1 ATPase subunit 8 [Esox niger]